MSTPARAPVTPDSRRSLPSGLMKETLAPVLRAAALAAFIVGAVIFLLNPPSLSGAGELLTLVVVAVALVLTTAWVTVTLMGDGPSEREVERLVARSEALARNGSPIAESEGDFERLVQDAIERLPEEFRDLLKDTPVVISDRGADARAYGHYFGDGVARDNYEDRIVVYRDTLQRDFGHDPDLLAAQVERTLRHELAHHLGWKERGVRELGL